MEVSRGAQNGTEAYKARRITFVWNLVFHLRGVLTDVT
jgi:hypothetical protein